MPGALSRNFESRAPRSKEQILLKRLKAVETHWNEGALSIERVLGEGRPEGVTRLRRLSSWETLAGKLVLQACRCHTQA